MISDKPKDLFRTPQELFQKYNRVYKFTLDGAANENDRLCEKWLGPGSEIGTDALQVWPNGELFRGTERQRVWINPPYSLTKEFVHWGRAINLHNNIPVVMLLPVWTDRKWFHEVIYNEETGKYYRGIQAVEFIKGRVRFLNPDGTKPANTGRFPSMVVTFGDNG